MANIQIKNRWTGAVLFEGGMTMRQTLEKAMTAKADLSGANLRDANLRDARLSGARLSGKKLVGKRPFFTIGPIGSRCSYVQAWLTDAGVMIRAGCFLGTRAKFAAKLEDEHGDNEHGQEYRAALALIDKHAELWTPVVEVATEESAEVAT